MRILVTGANGFLGKWVCADLLGRGHSILGGVRSLSELKLMPAPWRNRLREVNWLGLELGRAQEVEAALQHRPDAVVHLAALASGAQARTQPIAAWETNCLGTCQLLYAVERISPQSRFLLTSTADVYGPGLTRPARETDPVAPCSPYAASKAAAELAVQEVARRIGAGTIIARLFPMSGPEQAEAFVASAIARRIRSAQRNGRHEIPVGNLAPIRELLDVRDVAVGLGLLVERADPGSVYNLARGEGLALQAVFDALAGILGWSGTPVPEPRLFRQGDILFLVGDGSRIADLGWRPEYTWRTTLEDLVASL